LEKSNGLLLYKKVKNSTVEVAMKDKDSKFNLKFIVT